MERIDRLIEEGNRFFQPVSSANPFEPFPEEIVASDPQAGLIEDRFRGWTLNIETLLKKYVSLLDGISTNFIILKSFGHILMIPSQLPFLGGMRMKMIMKM